VPFLVDDRDVCLQVLLGRREQVPSVRRREPELGRAHHRVTHRGDSDARVGVDARCGGRGRFGGAPSRAGRGGSGKRGPGHEHQQQDAAVDQHRTLAAPVDLAAPLGAAALGGPLTSAGWAGGLWTWRGRSLPPTRRATRARADHHGNVTVPDAGAVNAPCWFRERRSSRRGSGVSFGERLALSTAHDCGLTRPFRLASDPVGLQAGLRLERQLVERVSRDEHRTSLRCGRERKPLLNGTGCAA